VTLRQVLEVARNEALPVLEAGARLDAAAGRSTSAQGDLLPTLRLDLGARRLAGRQVGSFGGEQGVTFTRYRSSLGIFYHANPASALARLRAAHSDEAAASLERREAERLAMLSAGLAYHDLQAQKAAQEIAEGLVEDARRFLAIAKARTGAGIGAGAEVARAEAARARSRRSALLARSNYEQASVRLATLLRWDPRTLLEPAAGDPKAQSLVDASEGTALLERAEASRPDLLASQRRAESASQRAQAAWWDLVAPDLDAHLGGRLLGTQPGDLGDTLLAGAFLGFSFDFQELGRIRTAAAEELVGRLRARGADQRVRGELQAALSRLQAAQEILPEARAEAEAAERSYQAQLARFQAGSGLGIEVIAAQEERARARLGLTESLLGYNVAQLRLAAVIGQLGPELLRGP